MSAARPVSRMKIRVIKHERVPYCGSYKVRFPDGRPSKYFYFENLPGRRLRPDRVEQATAEQSAERFAREEWSDLCGAMCLLMNLTSVKKRTPPVSQGRSFRTNVAFGVRHGRNEATHWGGTGPAS